MGLFWGLERVKNWGFFVGVMEVKFTIGNVEDYLFILEEFLLRDSEGWGEPILKIYPELKEKFKKSDDKKEAIKQFFKKQEEKYSKIMEKVREDFQRSWDKLNDDLFNALEEVNEMKFPEEMKNFTARITLNPICPRYLKNNSFDVLLWLC